jgi:hypothetical protein
MTLKEEAQKIQDFLEITMSDNPAEVVERGNDLVVYISRTGKMLADAKLILNESLKNETMQTIKDFIIDKKLSAKVQNALIDGLCREQKYMVDWIERLNATCTHQLDWCRSLVSKNKEEMKYNNIGKEFR